MNHATSDQSKSLMFWSIGLAAFWVIFLWGFFDDGPYTLGVNAAVFLFLALGFFGFLFPSEFPLWRKKNYAWLVPFLLIAVSYAVYANPEVKAISIPVTAVLLVTFVTYALFGDPRVRWGSSFVRTVIVRAFAWIVELGFSFALYVRLISGAHGSSTARRVVLGVILLVVVVSGAVVPLLSAADPLFGAFVRPFVDFLSRLIATETLVRIIVGIVLAIGILAVGLAWRKRPAVSGDDAPRATDSIVAGIVVGGIFLVYVLFLAVQIKRLWVSELPIDFSETEALVKSGFWQLFFLSIINGFIFLATYTKTNQWAQRLLTGFTIASLLLIFSAAWRMVLYVVFYGFSYEKFFASYTVIFSIILFTWLVAQFASKKRRDLVKFGVFLFLWMYAVLAIFPIDQFIMRTNLKLAEKSGSRIALFEMTMLSSDVLGYVEDRKDDPRFEGWGRWLKNRRDRSMERTWYEMSVSDVVYRLKH